MRPHLRKRRSIQEALGYPQREGAALYLGGTVLPSDRASMTAQFTAPNPDGSSRGSYLHITLSAPAGITFRPDQWREIAAFVLDRLSLPHELVPWAAWLHTDTPCQHIHIVANCRDFTGREIDLPDPKATCAAIHQELCDRLGLPEPVYFDPDAAITLDAPVPMRRRGRALRMLADALKGAFQRFLPTDLATLNDALARFPGGFRAARDENRRGQPSVSYTGSDQTRLRGGELGDGWEPRFLFRRLAHAGAVRRRLLDLQARATMRALFRLAPDFFQHKEDFPDDRSLARPAPSASVSQPLRVGQAGLREPDEGREGLAPAPRPAEAAGRRDRLRGEASGVDHRHRAEHGGHPEEPGPHRGAAGGVGREHRVSDTRDLVPGREDHPPEQFTRSQIEFRQYLVALLIVATRHDPKRLEEVDAEEEWAAIALRDGSAIILNGTKVSVKGPGSPTMAKDIVSSLDLPIDAPGEDPGEDPFEAGPDGP